MKHPFFNCWLCESPSELRQRGIQPHEVVAHDFNVTNKAYGVTYDIYCCRACGFEFCPTAGDPIIHYKQLYDVQYVETSQQRLVQARKIIDLLIQNYSVRTLLDVGAGCGSLLQAASEKAIDAQGIEPCDFFADVGRKKGLNIITGTLPHPSINEHYDAVALVDVLEHTSLPKQLIEQCLLRVKPGGMLLFITPDRQSFFARILGKKWWHRRIAHISYFSQPDIRRLLTICGVEKASYSRPYWYFSVSYLLECILSYVPGLVGVKIPFGERQIVRLNLFDSWCVIVKK